MVSLHFSFIAALVTLAIATPTDRSALLVHEHRAQPARGFVSTGPAPSDAELTLRIALNPSNIAGLESELYAVSDPSSSRYGQHLTPEDACPYIYSSGSHSDAQRRLLNTSSPLPTRSPLSLPGFRQTRSLRLQSPRPATSCSSRYPFPRQTRSSTPSSLSSPTRPPTRPPSAPCSIRSQSNFPRRLHTFTPRRLSLAHSQRQSRSRFPATANGTLTLRARISLQFRVCRWNTGSPQRPLRRPITSWVSLHMTINLPISTTSR